MRSHAYRFMVLEQLADIAIEADVLLEPMRRDSALGSNYYANNIIHTLNEILETAATDHDLPFIDLAAPMRNSEGSLRAGASIDGSI